MTLPDLLATLHLAPHPEGGFFRETFRSTRLVPGPGGASRAACTQILYALGAGDFSAWHRVASDELWQHHEGGALELHVIDHAGHRVSVLGAVSDGHVPQGFVPAGAWQAARPVEDGAPYVLVGCTVAPGFDFADFELADPGEMFTDPPGLEPIIRELAPRSSQA